MQFKALDMSLGLFCRLKYKTDLQFDIYGDQLIHATHKEKGSTERERVAAQEADTESSFMAAAARSRSYAP